MIIKKTKAAILVQSKKPLVIDEINFQEKLKKGQVLVEMIYSGICGSQIGEIDAVKGKDKYLPHLLGHEGLAEVLDVGKGVTKVKRGDKVILHWMQSDELSSDLPNYTWKGKKLNAGLITTFNEHAVISQNRLTKINTRINDLDALLLGCTSSTAIGTVFKLSNILNKQICVVAGCGAIGLYIIKLLKYLNVRKIVAIDINSDKLRIAKKYGATHILNNKKISISHILAKEFKDGVDYFFECTGDIDVISSGFKHLKQNGSEVLIGVPPKNKYAKFYTLEINLGKKLIGCKGGNFVPQKDIVFFSKLMNKKKLGHKNFILNKIKIDKINEIISEMKSGKILGKSVIVF